MVTFFTVLSGVATVVSEPVAHHVTEVPELASMALLSVVLAGVSVVVRRTGLKTSRNTPHGRRDAGQP